MGCLYKSDSFTISLNRLKTLFQVTFLETGKFPIYITSVTLKLVAVLQIERALCVIVL